MTDNTTNKDEADAGSGAGLITVDSPQEVADLPHGDTEVDDLPEDLTETVGADSAEDGVLGNGAVSGGFGFAGLGLALVSLTTNWTSGIVVNRGQISDEMHAGSSGLTVQQELDMYARGWHTQGWWALVFAAAAVLVGAGALFLPGILGSGRAPGWARAAATSAVIVGLVGALLAVLTITGVFGGHLAAPTSGG